MIQLQSKRDGLIATVEAVGLIDTRGAQEFEGCVVGLCNDGVLGLVIDLQKVDLITSAGIRVLVMMGQRLQRSHGGLALCSLSERVRGVLEIAGLLTQFLVTTTREEAVTHVFQIVATTGLTPPVSRLARLTNRILAEDDKPGRRPRPLTAPAPSGLTGQVLTLFRQTSSARDGEKPAGRP